ncbi:reverse transcriptase domain-containing protein [Tanacetum coccineum]|uniref:Reverse transcriptase domain-containing protein n=1 Tax=Tanacetum coccineum TaxID=301880 RepID=A0ABQ4ZB70_9ASTR
MRTRSSSNLVGESSPNPTTSNPRCHNRRRSKQRVEPFSLEESPVDTMADQRTMVELLRAPTEGYAEAIMVPPILAEHFELKHSLINMMTSDQFFELEKDNPRDHIRWFNKITSTIKYKDVPNSAIKLMLFPFSLAGAARRWLEEEPPRSILTWDDLVSKFINEFFPPSRTTNLRNEISNFQQRFGESFHEAWDCYKDLLRACPHHDAILKQFQATPPPASVKAIEEICVTCGGAHPYYQFVPLSELEKIKKINDVNIKAMQARINNVKNELRNEMQTSIQASMSNQTNELKNMMASFFQMNTASTSGLGSLPSNIVANPRGELKAITTRSGLVLDGPSIPMSHPFINPEEDERVEETLTDPELAEYTIKVPPPLVQKAKPLSLKNYVVHQRDPRHPHIPYPSRMHQEKRQEKDEGSSCPLILGRLSYGPFETLIRSWRRDDFSVTSGSPLRFRNPRPSLLLLPTLLSIEESELIWEEFKAYLTSDSFPPGNSNPSSPFPPFHNSLSGRNDDLPFDAKFDLRELEYLLNHDPIKEMYSILEDLVDENSLDDNLNDTISEMFTDFYDLL